MWGLLIRREFDFMKTCHVCGCLVDDKEIVCPECGATVVKATSGLSLKADEPEKKRKSNPIGTTVSTGSGLTDILRGEDDGVAEDDPYNGGSIPMSVIHNVVDDDDEPHKKKSGKVFSVIIKILLLAAVAFGIYYLVTNVIMKDDVSSTYEAALDTYIKNINDKNASELSVLVPSYVSDPVDEAQMWIEELNDADITEYNIVGTEYIDSTTLTELEEDVKLNLNRSIDISEGITLTVEFRGTSLNNAGNAVSRGGELKLQFIKMKNKWYFLHDNFDSSLLTK